MTPLKPSRWRLAIEGNAVSLYPSIGNWSTGCQSHYWIRNNRIDWALAFTPEQIAANRARDQYVRQEAHAERYRRERVSGGAFGTRLAGNTFGIKYKAPGRLSKTGSSVA
ncbi:DUF6527 family protein [Bradyrhizobium sp. S3.2.12]|uniref:DUF6527 family protein n=1 Tax=Bradyrhizobium sp. S3.2.12 TaxID=3156387 RepID=UPI003394FF8D